MYAPFEVRRTLIRWQEIRGPEPGPRGSLQGTLIWASQSIEASTRLVREFAASQRALPRITVDNLGIPPAHEQPSAITSAPPDFTRGFMDKNNERDRMKDAHRRLGSQYPGEGQLRPPESGQVPPSPHPTASSASVYGVNQSPMGMGGSVRMLPSPSSLHTASSMASVQGGFSPSSSQSAQASHMQDLQHQISTKSLALTTLQREHDQLLAAYSRMQVRCQTLDKKSQVSDHEINTITEDKLRLQAQADALESQVDELIRARDDAQKQTTASGAQYMQIMSMSSKLQAQGASEARRYKTEREEWERDRNGLQDRIQMLESGSAQLLTPSIELTQPQSSPALDDVLNSASLDVLRSEVVRLRQSLMAIERQFIDLGQETKRLDQVIDQCTGIRERLATKTMAALPQPSAATTSPAIRLAKSTTPVHETCDTFMVPDDPITHTEATQHDEHEEEPETEQEVPKEETETGTFLITESGDDSIL